MHRAAAAAAIALFLAEELGEHQLGIGPLADAMAMAAMCRGDVVGIAQGHGRADGRGLLADRQMHGAVNEAAHIGVSAESSASCMEASRSFKELRIGFHAIFESRMNNSTNTKSCHTIRPVSGVNNSITSYLIYILSNSINVAFIRITYFLMVLIKIQHLKPLRTTYWSGMVAIINEKNSPDPSSKRVLFFDLFLERNQKANY